MEVKTFKDCQDEVAKRKGFKTWSHYVAVKEFIYSAGVDDDIKEAAQEYTRQIALAACEEQKNLCAEDLPYRTTKLTIYCVLNTPPPTEFINQLLNR